MPQPKPTLLDRLFGAQKRAPVPRVSKRVGEDSEPTPETKTSQHREDQVLSEEPAATPSPASTNYAELNRTSTELQVLQEAALRRSMDLEKAFYYGQMGQQQQMNQQQMNAMLGMGQQMTGVSNPQQGVDPDPRRYLPYWKRHFGDLGGGFTGGGK